MLFLKFVCGFQNNMTCFQNHEICFQHTQCVVLKGHVGLYVESKLHGYMDFIFCLFLFDRTARINPTKVLACQGSFGGFKTACFQLDWATRIKTTGISHFSCNRSPLPKCREVSQPEIQLGLTAQTNTREMWILFTYVV